MDSPSLGNSYDQKLAGYQWGRAAEKLACDYLVAQGLAIREQNWRPGRGHAEIDIIAQEGSTIVFVEVKARTTSDIDPAEAVDLKKQKLMARGADTYLRSLPYDFEYRFDIIAITGTESSHTLTHYPDAFLPPLSTR
jgi:putative endonuclease